MATKISKELKQRLINYLTDQSKKDKFALDLLQELSNKKKGRKVGWRKPKETHESVIEKAYKEHTGQI